MVCAYNDGHTVICTKRLNQPIAACAGGEKGGGKRVDTRKFVLDGKSDSSTGRALLREVW